jgi:hypothetical protein
LEQEVHPGQAPPPEIEFLLNDPVANFNHPLRKEAKSIIHKGDCIKMISVINLFEFV